MSDSDNEYELMRQRSKARKSALLASLGFNTIADELKKTIVSRPDKIHQHKRRKVPRDAVPMRRSFRIQEKRLKVKYVKGFLGFESFTECDIEVNHDGTRTLPGNAYDQTKSNDTGVQIDQLSESSVFPKYERKIGKEHITKIDCENIEKDIDETKLSVEYKGKENLKLECDDLCLKERNTELIETRIQDSNIDVNGVFDKNAEIAGQVEHPGKEGHSLLNQEISASDLKLSRQDDLISNDSFLNNQKVLDTPWDKRAEESCLEMIKNSVQMSYKYTVSRDEISDTDDDWDKYEEIKFTVSVSEDESEGSEISSSSNNDSDKSQRKINKKNNSYDVPTLPCENVTEEMISNIAKNSSRKVYDQLKGTTCHQCRQKTSDTKTICRSGKCVGVRGMFCGTCLPKRYGEEVANALKNPLWECPVCRGICNCSFCRTRKGKDPTGILYPIARQRGYNNVAEYLKENEKEAMKKRLKVIQYFEG